MGMKEVLHFTWKTLAVSIIMLLFLMIASAAFPMPTDSASGNDGSVMILLFIITTVYALLIGIIMQASQGSGLQLIFGVLISFYGIQTVVGQIEALFFLTPLGEDFGAGSVPVMQMPAGFIGSQFFIWAVVTLAGVVASYFLIGKKRIMKQQPMRLYPKMTGRQWLWRTGAVILAYEVLYFSFGYFVAWRDPAIREFYQGTDPGSFLLQMQHVFSETPALAGLQAFRAVLWMLFVLPVIGMLSRNKWWAALFLGFYTALPLTLPNIMPNPYMPEAVRMTHFTETAASTFIFGVLLFTLFRKSFARNSISKV
ncbi:MAG: hypothetical protein K9L68_06595 [Spirochaetales bacterium]|nr:hypothetical protein [Spirochaetales bacterium]MCF7938252.1 hypothetical protein [Spirochaetales bacterium]